jgi:hypothetical protein
MLHWSPPLWTQKKNEVLLFTFSILQLEMLVIPHYSACKFCEVDKKMRSVGLPSKRNPVISDLSSSHQAGGVFSHAFVSRLLLITGHVFCARRKGKALRSLLRLKVDVFSSRWVGSQASVHGAFP